MPRPNKTLTLLKHALAQQDLVPTEDVKVTKKTAKNMLHLFSLAEDPRKLGMIDYPLSYILMIVFLAVLGSADTWSEIADFAQEKEKWLGKFLPVKTYGIPSHDTFNRVMGLLPQDHLEALVVCLLKKNLEAIRKALNVPEPETRQICIDGKEENGSGRNYSASFGREVFNTQTLHIYDATDGVCLFSRTIDRKTNEIPVAQELLQTMDLKQCICTFDAMHMQVKTLEIIRAQKGHYVGGLKENQPTLLQDVTALFTEEELKKLKKKRSAYLTETEKAHGNVETREYYLIPAFHDPDREKKWKDMNSFVLCRKTAASCATGDVSSEDRFYATDLKDLTQIAQAIRTHWAVESFHWFLDTSFHQDSNSTMNANALLNLAQINKMCLHLCQLMQLVEQKSVRRLRKKFGWNFEESLAQLLTLFDNDAITEAIKEIKKAKAAKE